MIISKVPESRNLRKKSFLPIFWHDWIELVGLSIKMLLLIFSGPFFYKNFRKYYYIQNSLKVIYRF